MRRRACRTPGRALATRTLLGVLLAGVLGAVATPAAQAEVPAPGAGEAIISVKVGGDRLADGSVAGLQGVSLALHGPGTATSSQTVGGQIVPVLGDTGSRYDSAWSWTTCVSDADGDCNFVVPIRDGVVSESGVPQDTRFWVVLEASPSGWYSNPTLRTGSFAASPEFELEYRFRTDTQLRAGQVYQSSAPLVPPTGSWNNSDEPDRGFMRNRTDTNSEGSYGANATRTLGIWSQSRINPTFPAVCGLKVALVADTSGSLGLSGMIATQAAIGAFVDAFVGTPTQMSLFSFSTVSPGDGASNHPTLLPVTTTAQADAFKAQYAAWAAGGGTSWDRGFAAAANSGNDYDLVVLLTDGNPTVYGASPGGGSSAYNSFQDVDAGVFSANQLKGTGARVIAIGVGPAVTSQASAANLRAVTGTTEGEDYFRADNFAEAADVLAELASATCQGGIEVQKMIVPTGGTIAEATPAPAGWQFDASTAAAGIAVVAPTSATTTADSNGTVTFGLAFTDSVTSGAVQVTETQQAGYDVVPVGSGSEARNAVCANSNTGVGVPVINAGTVSNPGFTVDAQAGAQIECTIYNTIAAAPGITVVKRINGDDANAAPGVVVAAGSVLSVTFDVSNTGNVPLSGVTLVDDVVAGSDIVAPAGWDGTLAVGQSVQFTASVAAAGPGEVHTNVGTVTGTPPAGPDVTDDDPANATTSPRDEAPSTVLPSDEPDVAPSEDEAPSTVLPSDEPDVAPSEPDLPAVPLAYTGISVVVPGLFVGVLALLLGLLLVVGSRKRSTG